MGHNRIVLGPVSADSSFGASGIGYGSQKTKVMMSKLFKFSIHDSKVATKILKKFLGETQSSVKDLL